MVEAPFVLSVTLMILFGLMMGAIAISYQQQAASLARQGARYAAVHGTMYAEEITPGTPPPDESKIKEFIKSKAAMDRTLLDKPDAIKVVWNSSPIPLTVNPDPRANPPGQPLVNTVTVTVTYTWTPPLLYPLLFPRDFTSFVLSSEATMPMAY
jgi:hypothetical protein